MDKYDALDIATERAHILFTTLGWRWATASYPPTPVEIRETFDLLARTIQRGETTQTGTGRLMAYGVDGAVMFCIEVGTFALNDEVEEKNHG